MEIPYYQVDAFTNSVFSGNPAGVCLLDSWLDDSLLQAIAVENNLPETAFLVKTKLCYELRWFTPKIEVDLCGHATLASAFVVIKYVDKQGDTVHFESKSGSLTVTRKNDLLTLNFPSRKATPCHAPTELLNGLGAKPKDVLRSRDFLAIYHDEKQIKTLKPNMTELTKLDCLGVIATAAGSRSDFVSRFFAPRAGIPEDPVTGSAHCTLTPYWSKKLGKSDLHAFQLSNRGGELFCKNLGDRVLISGRAVTFLEGMITLD